MTSSSGVDCNSSAFAAGRHGHEDIAHAVARIERLGKNLFGVSACVVCLHAEADAGVGVASVYPSQAHQFCAQLPLGAGLQVAPEKSSPFNPPLGRVDHFEVRFYALHPVRDQAGKVVGRIALIHERTRAFTAGDGHWMADLVALIERELHFSGLAVSTR